MSFLRGQFKLSESWSNLRSKLRDDPDLLGKAALVLFITGALMVSLVLILR